MFDFQPDDINEKKFKTNSAINPILYTLEESKPIDLYFLVEHYLPSKILNDFKNHMRASNPLINYQIISALPFIPKEKDLKKQIIELYGLNSIDLKKYIPDWSKVVTVGRGIYSILKGDDLCIEGFYDTILWKTSFFAPEIKSQIFPIPHIYSWLGKDTFENLFTLKQIKIANEYKLQKIRLPQPNLVLVENPNEHLEQWKNYNGITAWDLETKTLDPWDPEGKVICLTCAYESELKEYKAYYLPFDKVDINLLSEWFKTKKLVGNNLKYDVKWQRVKHGIPRECVQIFWDNMKGSHAINEMQYNSLKSDAWLYSFFGGYDLELELYKIKYPKCKNDYSKIPQSIMFPYATMDALVSLICYKRQQIEIDELDRKCPTTTGWSIRKALEEVAFPAINAFADIEINGMCYDWEKLKKLSQLLQDEVNKREEDLRQKLNIPVNINLASGDQLGSFLEKLGWENPGRSEKGYFVTNDAAMQYWRKKGHLIVEDLQAYTECCTVLKTFVGLEESGKTKKPSGYFQYRKTDDKIHGTFRVMMADSGRGRSSDPNLQNVIKNSSVKIQGRKLHDWVRECFCTPSDEFVFSENDAAGLQLRIAASMSQDPVMVDIFLNRGGDMHSITGNAVFCPDVPLIEFLNHKKEEPYKTYRKKAKAVNFGLLFGATSRTFATTSLVPEWTLQEAKDYCSLYRLESIRKRLFLRLSHQVEEDRTITDKQTALQDAVDFSYFWAAAEDIRVKFFAKYTGLAQYHKESHKFGQANGYVQSSWGFIRRTPYLVYRGKQDDGGRIKNYENICLNSPVQNFEACYMMYNISRVIKDLAKGGFSSYLIGNVHDSFLGYLKREEMAEVKRIFLDRFHEPIPSVMKGIPYIIELGYSDYQKQEYWGVTEHEF